MAIDKLTSQTFFRNPFPVLAGLRAEGPLLRTRIPFFGKAWLTTTHSAATRILKDHETFTQRTARGGLAGLKWWMPRSLRVLAANMLTSDREDHKRLRSLVDEAFRRRNVADMAGGIEKAAGDLADGLARNGGGDIVSEFARLLPLLVISDLLGLPRSDREFFIRSAGSFGNVTGIIGFFRMVPHLKKLSAYLDRRFADARYGNGKGLIAHLVDEAEDGRATPEELLATAFLLLVAGHETTTHLISGSVKALVDHPEQRAWLAADLTRLDLAVEEMLRFVSPVQSTKPRYVRRDADVDGVTIPANAICFPFVAAANADPAMFEAPERMVLDRRPNPHIAFGTGVHFCLGHQLARLEARIALQTLLTRFPAMRLSCPEGELEWRRRFGMRALVRLPVVTE